MAKYVYFFGGGKAEGKSEMKNLLGGKGANLAEMANLGLPVPPGFTITTEVCTLYYRNKGKYPAELKKQVEDNLKKTERIMEQEVRRRRRTRCWSPCAPARAPRCPA